MLMSVDGKISTGDTDVMDVDSDLPKITGAKEGLHQYYNLEQQTDLFSLNSGRVFAKIGFNERIDVPKKLPVTFIVIDNKPHLNENGVRYLAQKAKQLILVTTNVEHPAYALKDGPGNVEILSYERDIDFQDLFSKLKENFGVDKLTIQSGGTLNAEFIRGGLVDYISIVIAPLMIGGKDTSTLMDGESLHTPEELFKIRPLKLESVIKLDHSYLHLKYSVPN